MRMSKKITGIAAGEAHTLALTGDGSIFSWGRGTFGRLGTGKDQDELSPVRIAVNKGDGSSSDDVERRSPRFVELAAGAYHSLALEDDGSVWSWGYNLYGQLGHGEENSSLPCLVQRFQKFDSPHSLAEESNAEHETEPLKMMDQSGLGATTSLGHGEENSSLPCLVQRFQQFDSPHSLAEESNTEHETEPLKVRSVKAGGMMSLAIDTRGTLWMWGNCPQSTASGEFSLLSSTALLPVLGFHGQYVHMVACGNEHIIATASAVSVHSPGELVCYAWGKNNHGQLGLGDNESRMYPEIIPVFNRGSQWTIYDIACGAFHTTLLTRQELTGQLESKCWTFGLGGNGQLGHGTTRSINSPEPVSELPEDVILISVDCGLFHTSVVSVMGDVWSWGMEKGLGLCPDACFTGNDGGDALSPLRIQSNQANGFKFPGPVRVACGAAHTVLVASDGDKLWAWGRGQSGVLGTGQTSDSFVPCVVSWPLPEQDSVNEDGGENGEVGRAVETDQRLSAAMEKIGLLQRKLSLIERYATVLHVSMFRKPFDERALPRSLEGSDVFDIGKELEGMMESAEIDELARMEIFYRGMLSTVKDKLMKRKIQDMVKECLRSTARQQYL